MIAQDCEAQPERRIQLKFDERITQTTKKKRDSILALAKPEFRGRDFF